MRTPLALLAVLCLAALSIPAPAQQRSSFEKLSTEAGTAREANRVDDAINLYVKALALRPAWDEGWWYLGTLYYGLDRYVDGRNAFRHLTLLKPDVAVAWGMLGLCEYENKQYDDALLHLHHAVDLGVDADPHISDVIHYHLILLLTRNGDYEASMKLLALTAQRGLNQPSYIEAEGLAALRKPLLPSELPPTQREMVMEVGRALYDASALRTNEAAAEFKLLVPKYANEPNIHYLYGSFLLYSDVNEGLAQIKKELEISPNHVPALVTLASEYLKNKDFKSALPYAEKAVDIDSHSFPAHAILGRVFSEGDIDPARGIKELELAKQIAPGSPEVRIALATAYMKAGRKEEGTREREEFRKLRAQIDEANKKPTP